MMLRLAVTYFLMVSAVVLSIVIALAQGGAILGSWFNLMPLALVVAVLVLRQYWSARNKSQFVLWHEGAQNQVLLLFAAAGVVSTFQWLFYFGRLALQIDLNWYLQGLSWVIQAAAMAYLAIAVVRLILRQPDGSNPQ